MSSAIWTSLKICRLVMGLYFIHFNPYPAKFVYNYTSIILIHFRVPRDSVVKCLTRNPGVLGSSRTGSSGFFRGSVLGQDNSELSLVLVKPRKA